MNESEMNESEILDAIHTKLLIILDNVDIEMYNFYIKEIYRVPFKIKTFTIESGVKNVTWEKSKIILCLYDENKRLHPQDILLFIAIHLMSLCYCREIGHTEQFENFNDLFLAINKKLGFECRPPNSDF